MEGLRLIPPVTRHFMLAAAAVTLPALLALVDLRRFGFYWPYLTKDFEVSHKLYSLHRLNATDLSFVLAVQLWRLATAFLYAGQGLPLLFDAFLFHRTSAGLETETYLLDSARYGWSLLWIAAFIQVPFHRNSQWLRIRWLTFPPPLPCWLPDLLSLGMSSTFMPGSSSVPSCVCKGHFTRFPYFSDQLN